MLEAEIRELRESVGNSVVAPPFDDLVSRSRRRRRGTIVGIAAASVLLVGAAAGAGQVVEQRAETPPVSHTNEPSGPGSADEIIDSDKAKLFDYEDAGDGRQLSQWAVDCSDDSCAAGLAWTTDDWASRETRLLDEYVNVELLANGLLVYSSKNDRADYLLTDDGDKIDVQSPTAAQPIGKNEIVIFAGDPLRLVALDPSTGKTHGLLGIDQNGLQFIDKLSNGDLRGYAERRNGDVVYLTSSDGGRNWTEHQVPVTTGQPGVLSTEENVIIALQGLQGVELTISNDAGQTWHQVRDLPFGGVGCMNPLSDGRLLLNQGSILYASTDATWRHFEKVEGAPAVNCLGHSFLRPTPVDTITAVTADQSGALISSDDGQTWTAVDPR